MSSWQQWVDNMMQYPGVNVAGIFGHDGSAWAKTANCNPTQAEVLALVAGAGKSAGEFTGFTFQGMRFMTLRLEDGWIDARSTQSSITVMRSTQTIVIGGYLASEGEQGSMAGCQKVHFAAEEIKKALAASGY